MSSQFTKFQRENAHIYAPEYSTDLNSTWVKEYRKKHNLTVKQYVKEVKDEIMSIKKLITNLYKKDKNREAQRRFREKNQEQRYVGSISVDLVYERENDTFVRNEIIPFDKKITKTNMQNEIKNTIENTKNQKLASMDYKGVNNIFVGDYTTDINTIRRNVKLEDIRMKDLGAGLIDGYEKQDWDTNTGRCVFDYIIARYGDIKGFKTVCTYENLNKVFVRDEEDTEKNLLDIGVNSREIKKFCMYYKIPMYAVDDNEKTFSQYTPPIPNKKCPAMIYRLSNKHFYPIKNRNKIQSITQTASVINNIDSDMIRYDTTQTDAETDDIKQEDLKKVSFVKDAMISLQEYINSGKIPEQITMRKHDLVGFKYENDVLVMNEDIELIQKLCENMNIKYKGQGITTLLLDIVKIATGADRLPKSNHNPYVSASLLTAKKDRVHYGFIDEKNTNLQNCTAWDITKCYTACMYYPSEDWIMLDYNDIWEDYDGNLKLGIYYIETEDNTLFKKSGYYTTCIIKKGLEEKIRFQIKKQLIAKKRHNKDLFTKIIDKVVEYSKGDTGISKLIINCMSGLLGQSERISTKAKINNDLEQIFDWLDRYYHLNEGIMINKIPNTDYYLYGFNKVQMMNETNIPMYLQVLDESNIRLYDMIKTMKGCLVARKVDCAIVRWVDKGATWSKFVRCVNTQADDITVKWGDYRPCKVPHIAQVEVSNGVKFIEDNDWIDYNINDSDNWEDIMKVFLDNDGLLLQSSAGNGKSYTAKQIAQVLGNKVKILAPTNIASLNIGGSTIHKFLQMTEQGHINPKLLKLIKQKYEYIIVDEISMIGKELWKRLCLLKRETGLKFLLLGDNKQCPAVEDEEIEDYFNHPAVKYLCNYNRNILTVRKRYDERLYNILNDVNTINKQEFPVFDTPRNICYFNRTRKIINKMWNERLKKQGNLFIEADDSDEYTQDTYIYEGLPVIARKSKTVNKNEMLFANSETFEVVNIDDKYIYLMNERPDENGVKEIYIYECPIENFRQYFVMNYCSTTHKNQGLTITENFTIYDWDAMSTKIKYTALSRARCCEQVCFGRAPFETYSSAEKAFERNIEKKLKGHLEYDIEKGYENDIEVDDIVKLYEKQNGECLKCGCGMKTYKYKCGDADQFSIDRINSFMGHKKGNIQLLCWNCNRAKMNRAF